MTITAACLGAMIGGALIWILETWVFNGTAPGIARDFVDWLAPLAGAFVFAWLERTHHFLGEHIRQEKSEPQ